jgi:DNA-binding transcriptional ArsR family regulator
MRPGQAVVLARLFSVLANPARLRMLHELSMRGEVSLTDLAHGSGASLQAASNQLQRLVRAGCLEKTRHGRSVRYRIADPCVPILLDRGRCLVEQAEGRDAC